MNRRTTFTPLLAMLVLAIALAFASCRTERYPRILTDADKLADTQPDSALRLLRSLEQRVDHEVLPTRMYWRLLLVKASDKVSQPMCTPDEIEEIVRYYTDDGDRELLPEALYYAGRVYRTCNDAPEARRYFLAAVEAMDRSFRPEDFAALRGKCFSQLGSLYLYQDLCGESVKMYQKAFRINHSANDTVGMVFNLRDVANAYLSMSKPDSSLIYIRSGIRLATEIADTLFLNELYLLQSAAQIERGDYTGAQADFTRASKLVKGKPSITQTTISARLAYATGDTATCRRLAGSMLAEGNLHDKRWASRILAELSLSNHNPGEAMALIRKYLVLNDSVTKIDRSQTILKMNALYDYSTREKENLILKAKNARLNLLIWISASLLVFLIVLSVLYVRYKRQQHTLMKLKIEKLENLRKESVAKDSFIVQQETDSIKGSAIYHAILQNVNAQKGATKLNDREWEEVASLIKKVYPDFEQRLLSLCRINDNEMKVSLLLKMGFAPSVIAGLTCHSKESVSATRRRLFEKAFGKKKATPREWDDFIRTL